MKVIHLITGLGVGGAEQMLLKVVPKLGKGHSIVSLTDNNSIGKTIEEEGVEVNYLGLKGLWNLPAVIHRLKKILKEKEPDILYCYLIHSNILGRIVGKMAEVPKVVCSIRNKHIDKKFLNWLDRATSSMVDLYVPNSPAVVPFLEEHQKIPKEKIKIIPNGIEMEKFNKVKVTKKNKREELGVDKKDFLVTCVAKFQKQKDHKTLIKAFADFQNGKKTKLLLAGEGPLRKEMEGLTERFGIRNKVLFTGNRPDVPEILQVTDLFILASRHEGMSNAILEAMASKVCCIVSNIEENKALIENEKTGLTFKTENERDLLNKMEDLYEDNKARKKYGEAAHEKIKKDFDIKSVVKKYEKVLEDL